MKRTTIYIGICLMSAFIQLAIAAYPALQYPLKLQACEFDLRVFIENQDAKLMMEVRNNIDLKELEKIKHEFCPKGAIQNIKTK